MRMQPTDIRLKADATATLFARDFAVSIAAGGKISAHLDVVSGVLGCDSRELAKLVAQTGAQKSDQVGDTLNTANLLWLYRHVHLARAVQVTVWQLVHRLRVSGAYDPEALARLIRGLSG